MDQTNGTTAIDRSTNNLSLTLKQQPTWTTNGLFHEAIHLDGAQAYLLASNSPAYNISNFTFSAWVRDTNAASGKRVIARWVNNSFDGWELDALNDGGRVRAHFNTLSQNEQYIGPNLSQSNVVRDGQWHHVALTFSAASNFARVYVDGDLEAEGTINGSIAWSVDKFYIGKGWESEWKGEQDEVRFYNRTLATNEIPLLPNTYADPDGDGLSNLGEYLKGTDPNNPDTDGDGIGDLEDPELNTQGPDTDGDGVSDEIEILQGRDPNKGAVPDTAGDVNLQVFTPLE